DVLAEVALEDDVEQPLYGNAQLLFQSRQLHQVNRPPQHPANQSRHVEPKEVRDSGPAADGRQQSGSLIHESFRLPAFQSRPDVFTDEVAFAEGVLRRGRIRQSRDGIGDRGAIARRPNSRMTGNLHRGIDDDPALLQFERGGHEDGARGNACGPDKGIGRYAVAVVALDRTVLVGRDFGIQFDFHASLAQLFLRVTAEGLAKLRQDEWTTVNQDDAHFPRIDAAVVRKTFAREIVDRANRLDARESAA